MDRVLAAKELPIMNPNAIILNPILAAMKGHTNKAYGLEKGDLQELVQSLDIMADVLEDYPREDDDNDFYKKSTQWRCAYMHAMKILNYTAAFGTSGK